MTPEPNKADTIVLESAGPEQTLDIGRCLATALRIGDEVALVGPLGAGKTQLAKGLALGLGLEHERLAGSPTFVLVNEYACRIPVYHMDAYRLGGEDELLQLGFDELCERGVVILEWADRVSGALSANAIWIAMQPTGENLRLLTLRTDDGQTAARLRACGLDRWRCRGDNPQPQAGSSS